MKQNILYPYSKVIYNKPHKESLQNNIILDVYFAGVIDVPLLRKALKYLILDNVILNSHITSKGGELYWARNNKLPKLKLFKDAFTENNIILYAQESFNLINGPLYRFKLGVNSNNEYRLIVILHPIIAANLLISSFVERLANYYNNIQSRDHSSSIPQLVTPSKGSESLLKITTSNKKSNILLESTLKEIGPLSLNFLSSNYIASSAFIDNRTEVEEVSEVEFNFDNEVLLKLKLLEKRFKIDSYLYSQSIIAVVINRYTRQNKFFTGSRVEKKKLKDFLINTYDNTLILWDFNETDNILQLMNKTNKLQDSLEKEKSSSIYYPFINKDLEISSVRNFVNIGFYRHYLRERKIYFNKVNTTVNIKCHL